MISNKNGMCVFANTSTPTCATLPELFFEHPYKVAVKFIVGFKVNLHKLQVKRKNSGSEQFSGYNQSVGIIFCFQSPLPIVVFCMKG
jgi:hypothetical protein